MTAGKGPANAFAGSALFLALTCAWSIIAESQESSVAPRQEVVRLRLLGIGPAVRAAPSAEDMIPTWYFSHKGKDALSYAKTRHIGIYPGIDQTCYGDDLQMEYVFKLQPGADSELVQLAIEGVTDLDVDSGGNVVGKLKSGEIVQNVPLICLRDRESTRDFPGKYVVGADRKMNIQLPSHFYTTQDQLNGTRLNLVPPGGQPGGPSHVFYMSKFEITHEEFLKFLNSAEANPRSARGANMFFDKEGNVWFNPAMEENRHELFRISDSRLSYSPDKPIGSRYAHWLTRDGIPASARHPVMGVSWYGAVKYCNWLTIDTRRGEDERCYTEGTNDLDWAPVTATNWANGYFGDTERKDWLARKGFRLPMVNGSGLAVSTNMYSEFYKAGAWNGTTNRLYGFGRDNADPLDASYTDTNTLQKSGPMPIGYFDGKNRIGERVSRANGNFYGVYDLSGNAEEWSNDPIAPGHPGEIACLGGSWDGSLPPVSLCRAAKPSMAVATRGFRVVTTYIRAPAEVVSIHVLYSFFMEPAVAAAEKELEGPVLEAGKPEEMMRAEPAAEPPGGMTIDIQAPPRRPEEPLAAGIVPPKEEPAPIAGGFHIPPPVPSVPTSPSGL